MALKGASSAPNKNRMKKIRADKLKKEHNDVRIRNKGIVNDPYQR